MDSKVLYLILKVSALLLSIVLFMWLLPMGSTVSDKWFSTWLQGTIACGASVIFFTCWIADSIIRWNRH